MRYAELVNSQWHGDAAGIDGHIKLLINEFLEMPCI